MIPVRRLAVQGLVLLICDIMIKAPLPQGLCEASEARRALTASFDWPCKQQGLFRGFMHVS